MFDLVDRMHCVVLYYLCGIISGWIGGRWTRFRYVEKLPSVGKILGGTGQFCMLV